MLQLSLKYKVQNISLIPLCSAKRLFILLYNYCINYYNNYCIYFTTTFHYRTRNISLVQYSKKYKVFSTNLFNSF